MNRTLSFLDRHPWLPLGTVLAAFTLAAVPVILFALLFFLGEAAIGS